MKTKILTILTLFCTLWVCANNVEVENVEIKNYNEAEGWAQIECDISWSNSWRIDSGPSNWDAVWVFAKYRANRGPWSHVTLEPNQTTVPTGFTIDVSSDNNGAVIYRSDVGSGRSNLDDILLGWDIPTGEENATFEVQVFAIEMVYVPEGSFYIGGSAGTEVDDFSSRRITSENEVTLTYGTSSTSAGDGIGLLPAEFPKGYNAFYCMKYEISEAQYVAYFNTLEVAYQQGENDISSGIYSSSKNSDAEVDGNTFSWLGAGTEATTTAPDRACGFMSSNRLKWYLGWAALRPMTELEYEKAARGPSPTVDEAYAWGTPSIMDIPYNLTFLTTINGINEYVSNGVPNVGKAAYNLTTTNYPRPTENGMFGYNNSSGTREKSGASYYGIMELSGNIAEMVVSVGDSNNRNYAGVHGTGTQYNNYEFGIGFTFGGARGGSWNSDAGELRIADRTYGGGLPLPAFNTLGGRGVRTAE